jgi:small membrane protein
MLLIQIILIAFAVLAFLRAFFQFRKGNLNLAWLLFWLLFWVAVGFAVLLPQTTDMLAHFVGVGRGVDVVMYLSLIALFYLVFRLFIKIEGLERDITKLVRSIALKEVKDD